MNSNHVDLSQSFTTISGSMEDGKKYRIQNTGDGRHENYLTRDILRT